MSLSLIDLIQANIDGADIDELLARVEQRCEEASRLRQQQREHQLQMQSTIALIDLDSSVESERVDLSSSQMDIASMSQFICPEFISFPRTRSRSYCILDILRRHRLEPTTSSQALFHFPFSPSGFQAALLAHMRWQRQLVGHKTGLLVLATALGKTILAILDIESEIMELAWMARRRLELFQDANIESEHVFTPKKRRLLQNQDHLSAIDAQVQTEFCGFFNLHNCACACSQHRLVVDHPDRFSMTDEARQLYQNPTVVSSPETVSLALFHDKVPAPPPPTVFRFLFLVHSKAIRDTTMAKFQQHFAWWFKPGAFVKVEDKTDEHTLSRASFMFCLLQSFDKIPDRIVRTITHVVYDEVHHALAETWAVVLNKLQQQPSLVYLLGITATLSHREDPFGTKLKRIFQQTVYAGFPWTLAKAHGFFPKVRYFECLPRRSANDNLALLGQYATHLNDLVAHGSVTKFLSRLDSSLKAVNLARDQDVRSFLSAERVVSATMSFLRQSSPKQSVMIFSSSCEQADEIARLLCARGESAAAAHSKVNAIRQAALFNRFCRGRIRFFVSVNMLNEGFDVPRVDCVVLARLTDSEIVFVQQLGRGLRLDPAQPDKEVAVLDLALNLRRRWHRLCEQLPDDEIANLVHSFWPVEQFDSQDTEALM